MGLWSGFVGCDRRPAGLGWVGVVGCLAVVASACTSSDGTEEPSLAAPPASSAVEVETVPWPTASWPVSTPEEQGMDSGVLAELVDRVVAEGGIDSVMVVRNGYAVVDAVVYPFPGDTAHNLQSCTKSVTGTLIGIAIDRGLLAGVEVPVLEILPDAAPGTVDDSKASMTVEDLLTMSTGLECRDSYLYGNRGLGEMRASDDWAAHVLALPVSEEPGSRFEYCNGASFLLSAILSEVTGRSASEFARETLFEPLGITEFVWPASPDGITLGESELTLRPADMAKIGLLYLRNGEWDGEQLASQGWIEAATALQIRAGTVTEGYGYQWWVDDAGYAFAYGAGGQVIFVVPDRDLVVVFTSGLPPSRELLPKRLLEQYVLEAAQSEPLPPDPDAQARLTAAISAAGSAPEPSAVDVPDVADTIDDSRYQFRPNQFGHRWFTLTFDDDSARLEFAGLLGELGAVPPEVLALLGYRDLDKPIEIEVGLDGRFVIDEAWGRQWASRGTWVTESTFLIEYHIIGQVQRGSFRIRFEDDLAHLSFREERSGVVQASTAERTD